MHSGPPYRITVVPFSMLILEYHSRFGTHGHPLPALLSPSNRRRLALFSTGNRSLRCALMELTLPRLHTLPVFHRPAMRNLIDDCPLTNPIAYRRPRPKQYSVHASMVVASSLSAQQSPAPLNMPRDWMELFVQARDWQHSVSMPQRIFVLLTR